MTQISITIITIILCLVFWSFDALSLIKGALNKSSEYAVVRVIDGDGAIVLSRNNKQSEIRLAGIDAPEIGQQYGQISKATLKLLIQKKIVTIRKTGKKSYGRDIVKVYLNGVDINKKMVTLGAAWVEPRFEKRKSYYKAQDKARGKKLGLWYENKPMPPWTWRRIFGKYK